MRIKYTDDDKAQIMAAALEGAFSPTLKRFVGVADCRSLNISDQDHLVIDEIGNEVLRLAELALLQTRNGNNSLGWRVGPEKNGRCDVYDVNYSFNTPRKGITALYFDKRLGAEIIRGDMEILAYDIESDLCDYTTSDLKRFDVTKRLQAIYESHISMMLDQNRQPFREVPEMESLTKALVTHIDGSSMRASFQMTYGIARLKYSLDFGSHSVLVSRWDNEENVSIEICKTPVLARDYLHLRRESADILQKARSIIEADL